MAFLYRFKLIYHALQDLFSGLFSAFGIVAVLSALF